MKPMSRQDWINRIDVIVKQYKKLSIICDSAEDLGMMNTGGSLHAAIWDSFEAMLRMLDYDGWITWHIFENECGKKELEAGYKNERPIKTSADLADLILEGNEIESEN